MSTLHEEATMRWLSELFRRPGIDEPPHVPDLQADTELGAWEGMSRWPADDDDVPQRPRGFGATAYLSVEHGPPAAMG